jgi:hypothetical protein
MTQVQKTQTKLVVVAMAFFLYFLEEVLKMLKSSIPYPRQSQILQSLNCLSLNTNQVKAR